MTPKQLTNVLILARMGLAQFAADRGQPNEAIAEVAADLVAAQQFAATYLPTDANPRSEP